MRRFSILALLLGAVLCASVPIPAAAQQEPPRPRLPRGADPNDWEAYYTHAVTRMRGWSKEADAGFYWASRLDPSRAEPYFARWVTFWLTDFKRWELYIQGTRRVVESPEVAEAEKLRFTAYTRNPFVHQGLTLVLYDMLPGHFRIDPPDASLVRLRQARARARRSALRGGDQSQADGAEPSARSPRLGFRSHGAVRQRARRAGLHA